MSLSVGTRRARRVHVSRLDPAADIFALRDAIVTDDDAEVRAAALHRLDGPGAARLVPYVRDATDDPSMLVREAAFVALARARDAGSLARAARACLSDRGFRVRRMALLFAARTCGVDALPVLAIGSRDPFWRVRVAARRAGAALDATVDTCAVDVAPEPAVAVPFVDDPDPAVVTARLSRMRGRIEPSALVGALGHSHLALRRIAMNELAARGDLSALRAVAEWLADERVPYGPAAAEATLARAGARAAALATELVRGAADVSAGVLAWALRTASEPPEWRRLIAFLGAKDARVRRAAALRVADAAPNRAELLEALHRLLDDDDEEARTRAATWVARTGARDARAMLLPLDAAAQPTPLRLLLVGVRAGARDVARLDELARDAHGGVAAAALSALSALRALTDAERRAREQDPDPWIRHAVLVPERAQVALRDESALVRRAAVACVDGDSAARVAWAESPAAASDPDASLRALAAAVLAAVATEGATRSLLRLARDADFGVRSVAVDALAAHRASARALLDRGALDASERIAAYTLLRLGEHGGLFSESDPAALAHLALLDDVAADRAPSRADAQRPEAPPPVAHRRALGRTGIFVHPFGLSGAHGLAFGDFALAHERGVNLFFWEPRHRELARFLRAGRRTDTVVVAGTYHADAASIERDVVRTLRALKRDVVDVLLAFWTRSAARLDETTDVLRDLARRGLVRAAGVSTHDRALACDAADRGLDAVMVRHSAAHRGAERSVLPHCTARGTAVITFSTLCYGRMLHRTPAPLSAKVSAADCYRYSLSQPGVHACIAAPRRRSELEEDLAVVSEPSLSPEREAELRAHGDHVYAREKAWSAETWSVSDRPVTSPVESIDDFLDEPASISPHL